MDAVKPQSLRRAVAVGSSMLPLFRPGQEVRFMPCAGSSIRLGDVITYWTGGQALVTHRVIRIGQEEDQFVFLTKGDNRLAWDSPVKESQVTGKVTRIGNWNLQHPAWRGLGLGIARVSYAQGAVYQRLKGSRLNRVRHALERAGFLPRIQLGAK